MRLRCPNMSAQPSLHGDIYGEVTELINHKPRSQFIGEFRGLYSGVWGARGSIGG
jgi:hypothetical protein